MNKIFAVFNYLLVNFRLIFIFGITSVLIILFSVYLLSQSRLAGDTASHLLLAVSPIFDTGAPYKDVWEIKPPSWPFIVFFWAKMFGVGIMSIRILNLIIVVLIAVFTYLLYSKLFPDNIRDVIFLSTVLINFSPLLNTLLIPTEILGLLFSLVALVLLIHPKKSIWKFYLSGGIFFLASQSKEPYTFTALGAVPIFLLPILEKKYAEFGKSLASFVAGIMTIVLILGIYLHSLNSLNAYLEVFKYKQIYFPFNLDRLFRNFNPALTAANNTFIEFQGGILLILLLWFLMFLITNKFKKTLSYNFQSKSLVSKPINIITPNNLSKYAALFYSIGSLLGLGLGGVFGSHYLIQVVVPFYIICGLIVTDIYFGCNFLFGKKINYFYIGCFILLFSVFITLPKRQYVKSYFSSFTKPIWSDEIYSYERRITELTMPSQCILSVYGWGNGENYLYTKRRPCTRFFLANMVKEDWQKKEYAASILADPPALIMYHPGGADMDVEKFEHEVVNIGRIVRNCYKKDVVEPVLFTPVLTDKKLLSKCVMEYSK